MRKTFILFYLTISLHGALAHSSSESETAFKKVKVLTSTIQIPHNWANLPSDPYVFFGMQISNPHNSISLRFVGEDSISPDIRKRIEKRSPQKISFNGVSQIWLRGKDSFWVIETSDRNIEVSTIESQLVKAVRQSDK